MTLPLVIAGAGILVAGAVAFAWRHHTRRKILDRLRAEWGQLRERDRDMHAIAGYHSARVAAGWAGVSLDDRTWDDLNLDDVFQVLDRTESAVGRQVLYSRLREAPAPKHLAAFDALVSRFSNDTRAREETQLALVSLADPAAYDVWRIVQPGVVHTRPWYALFPVLALAMVGIVALIPFWPPAVLFLAAGAAVGLAVRGTVARDIQVVTGPFRQVGPLLVGARALRRLHSDATAPITGTLGDDVRRLARLRRIAGWAGRDAAGVASGDLGALAFEYVNLLFFLDANALFFGARELRERGGDLLRVIAAVGEIDAALSVASYRMSTSGWTRPVLVARGERTRMIAIRHPLLPDAVPNDIVLGPPDGVIITGSNMSGKSTFLRTVGVNAVLAQAINTCVADMYESPPLVIRSCIGRADDPATGRSYYLTEVDAVLALVRAARTDDAHLLLFDELFRGTNAVERIAAGDAVLAALVAPGPARHLVVAATHDQELVDLLAGRYAPYHFTDQVDASGLLFDYRMRPGSAATRNAIALLERRGAPPEIVEAARVRAASLDKSRDDIR